MARLHLYAARWLLRAALRSLISASMFGGVTPPTAGLDYVDEAFPPVAWWRREARSGVTAAEAFANDSYPSRTVSQLQPKRRKRPEER